MPVGCSDGVHLAVMLHCTRFYTVLHWCQPPEGIKRRKFVLACEKLVETRL